MGLAFSQIDDAVLLTLQNLVKRGAFVDMQLDLQDHIAVREMWKTKRRVFSGGETWDFQIQMDHNHSARAVGLWETDGSALTDTMVTGSVAPRHVNAHFTYDHREPDFQRGATKIVDLVETRRTAMMVSFFKFMEEVLWGKPVDSSDLKTPFGIQYWITRSTTEGFNGGNPSGFTAGKAGISATTYPRWQNWTAQYAAVSKTDLIRKMRTAHRKIQFRSPMVHATPDLGSMRNGIYANSTTVGLIEEELEKQNMNLGNDIDSKGGRATFKGTPIIYAPYLDGDATDPVYLLDWSVLAVGIMDGWAENYTGPYKVPNMHLVSRVDLDASFNMICTDLRKQAVISK